MTSSAGEYSVERDVVEFFEKTSAKRTECNARAQELVGGDIRLVPVQGVCSYTLYAGQDWDRVVQFRLQSLALPLETMQLARLVHGELVPDVSYHGKLGEEHHGQEPLHVSVMTRVVGISWLDFILAYGFPEDTAENCMKRLVLITDIVRFFARSWSCPQHLEPDKQESMHRRYRDDLLLLSSCLPERFRPIISDCLAALPAILALPVILLHKDFGDCNVLIDANSGHLTGVIDWAEAGIGSSGLNLYSIERFMGKIHLRSGVVRYKDYDALSLAFWKPLTTEIRNASTKTIQTIKSAMTLGLLLSRGFTSLLGNMPEPVPICDDEKRAYNMRLLDGWLLNGNTRFI